MRSSFLAILVLTLLFFSCSEDTVENEDFSRIIEDGSYNNAYFPVGIRETLDGGAIVVSAISSEPENYPGVVVTKIDDDGFWENESTLGSPYVSPSGEIMESDSLFYFFCMDENNFRTYIVSVNQEGEMGNPVPLGGSPTFPLAGNLINDQFFLLSYDAQNKRSVVSAHTADGNQTGSFSYTIGEGSDADPLILSHFAQRKSRLPFFIGEWGNGNVYFNGLYNFSLSLVFSNFTDTPAGVVQGQSDEGGVNALLQLEDGNYAVAGFQFETNFIRPDQALNEQGISSSINFLDRDIPEIKANSNVDIISYTIEPESYTVVAAETESRQIVLYFYQDEILIAAEYIGYLNGFNLGEIIVTEDNSILLLASTYTAGRFERIYVEKLSESRISKILP